jgi:hypothetical protein
MQYAKGMMVMDLISRPDNHLLWRAALLIYEGMTDHCGPDRAVLVAQAWDYLTADPCETFPATLMDPTQTGVTCRVMTIANRARWGLHLCPELDR